MNKITIIVALTLFVTGTALAGIATEGGLGGGGGGGGSTSPLTAELDAAGFLITDLTGPINLGSIGVNTHSLVAGDVLFGGAIEVDGPVSLDDSLLVADSFGVFLGNSIGIDGFLGYQTEQTPDSLYLGVGLDSKVLIFGDVLDRGFDFGHGVEAHPTMYYHSTNQDQDQWLSIRHDSELGKIETGLGGILLEPVTGNVSIAGGAPTLSACGSGFSVDGANSAGKLTVGTGVTTSCTVTFSDAFGNDPACNVTGDNTAVTYAATTTTTVMTVTSSADMASDVISYICIGTLAP